MSTKWRKYQHHVAELFRALGFEAKVEERLNGARGMHDIDVVTRFTIAGVSVLWIVECKLWKASVQKEQAMTLAQIAQDVGADRAFLLSESGFQAGALKSVRNSNVTLTSLQDLTEAAQEHLQKTVLRSLLAEKDRFEQHLRGHLYDEMGESPSLRIGNFDEIATLLGACLDLGLAAKAALANRYPVRLSGVVEEPGGLFRSPETLIPALQRLIAEVSDRSGLLDVRRAELGAQIARLADEIDTLVSAGDEVFEIAFEGPLRDERLTRCLAPMEEVEALTEVLRPLLGPKLLALVRDTRQCLIDGVYLVLATPSADRNTWYRHAETARKRAAELHLAGGKETRKTAALPTDGF